MCEAAIFYRGWTKSENSESSQVDWKRDTIFHYNLVPHLENLQNHSQKFICSCICCNWEVSFCIVSWFSQIFCTETSSVRCSCALFISPISCICRIWVFRRTFSFIDKSSCSRTYSRLDSTNPCCASCNANLCSSVCRCSSPTHLLRDSTWSSCFARSDLAWLRKWSLLPSRRDPLKFDGLAFLNTELLIKFPCSDENNALGFSQSFQTFRWMRPQTFISLGLSKLCTYLSLLHDHCIGLPRSFLGIQWWSQHLL